VFAGLSGFCYFLAKMEKCNVHYFNISKQLRMQWFLLLQVSDLSTTCILGIVVLNDFGLPRATIG